MASFSRQIAYAPGTYRFDLVVSTPSTRDALLTRLAASASFTIAADLVVPTFYTITKSAFDAWPHRDYAADPPPHIGSFPPETVHLAFYFQYAGTRPNRSRF